METRQAAIEAEEHAREEENEQRLSTLRAQWEELPSWEREEIERQVYWKMLPFIRTSVDRDRRKGIEGPGIQAFRYQCLQALENGVS